MKRLTDTLTCGAVVAFLALTGPARPAAAQIQAIPYAGYEGDGTDLTVLYAGTTIQKEGPGWSPFVNPFGYWITQDIEGVDDDPSFWAFAPTAGINRIWPTGMIGVGVGYLWLDDDAVGGATRGAVFTGGEEGVLTSFQGEYWGDGTWHVQGLGSVNWESEFVWARGRLSRHLSALGDDGGIQLGGEVVGQGNDDFSAFQVGPYLELRTGIGLRIVGGGGLKSYDDPDEDTGYWRLEVVYVPVG